MHCVQQLMTIHPQGGWILISFQQYFSYYSFHRPMTLNLQPTAKMPFSDCIPCLTPWKRCLMRASLRFCTPVWKIFSSTTRRRPHMKRGRNECNRLIRRNMQLGQQRYSASRCSDSETWAEFKFMIIWFCSDLKHLLQLKQVNTIKIKEENNIIQM